MAKPFTTNGRRIGALIASGLLLASVGCGWSHGRYASDPLLGNFNRPIAATPPIFTGVDAGTSPHVDSGVCLAQSPPNVLGTQKSSDDRIFILPAHQGRLGTGGVIQGGATGGNDSASLSHLQTRDTLGDRLPSPDNDSERSAIFVADKVALVLGSATAMERPRDEYAALGIDSLEEAHSLLTARGAKTQELEREPTGEWRFVCTLGEGNDYRRYEAKHRQPLAAVRAVLIQINGEKE